MRTNERRASLQSLQRMLQIAIPYGRGSHHERAVGNCVGHSFIFLGVCQHVRRAYGRTGTLEGHIVWVHHPQMTKAKVTHSSSRRAYVERIARIHQNHAQMIEFV